MPIYLDHNASSPMHAEVIDAMTPCLGSPPGNSPSLHGCGRNVAGIVGLGRAAELARLEIDQRKHHLVQLRTVFESVLSTIPGCILNAIRASCGNDNSLREAARRVSKLRYLVDGLPAVMRRAAG